MTRDREMGITSARPNLVPAHIMPELKEAVGHEYESQAVSREIYIRIAIALPVCFAFNRNRLNTLHAIRHHFDVTWPFNLSLSRLRGTNGTYFYMLSALEPRKMIFPSFMVRVLLRAFVYCT